MKMKEGEYDLRRRKKKTDGKKMVSTLSEEKKNVRLMQMKQGEYTFRRKKTDENERG